MGIVRDIMRGTTVTKENPRGAKWLCAFYDGRIVGCCCVVIKGEQARIKSFAVMRDYRGKGIGGKLLKETVSLGIRSGARKFDCYASAFSRNLFLFNGFRLVKRIPRGEFRETWYMEMEAIK